MVIKKQGFFSYSVILDSYLTGATFCVINPELPYQRKKCLVDQFNPDVIFCNESDKNIFIFSTCITFDFTYIKKECYNESINIRFFNNKHIYVMFTSGSTGMPKGCNILRMVVEKICIWAIKNFDIKENMIYGQYIPIHFDMSLIDIFCGVIQGVTLIVFASLAQKLRPQT